MRWHYLSVVKMRKTHYGQNALRARLIFAPLDLNECLIGGCDNVTTCLNNIGAPPTCGACPPPPWVVGNGATPCVCGPGYYRANETCNGV